MKHIFFLSILLLPLLGFSQAMDNDKLLSILKSESDSLVGQNGNWRLLYKDILMLVITDQQNDRMRMIMPITEGTQLSKKILQACLVANFHTALDVKYALSDGLLWAVYIHPLSTLTEAQVKSALSQVYSATVTFGDTYSSTDLLFGGGQPAENEPAEQPKLELKKG